MTSIFFLQMGGEKAPTTLQGTNLSPQNGILKMIFLLPRWDMLVPWKVRVLQRVFCQVTGTRRKLTFNRPLNWMVEIQVPNLLFAGVYMGVSKNSGTPKSSILIGFSIINHPFWGIPIFGNTHIYIYTVYCV